MTPFSRKTRAVGIVTIAYYYTDCLIKEINPLKGRLTTMQGTDIEQFEIILRHEKMRLTPQRLVIFQFIRDDVSHPAASELCEKIRKQFPTTSISLSLNTVLTNLDLLEKLQFVRRMNPDSVNPRYDGIMEPHRHFICRECGAADVNDGILF